MDLTESFDTSVVEHPSRNFAKMRVGLKTLDDAMFNISPLKKLDSRLADKANIQNAIKNNNIKLQREISNFFFKISGIYQRLCRHMANFYRYDYLLTPYFTEKSNVDKMTKTFYEVLTTLDKFGVKKFGGDVALKVIQNGCYYGYIIHSPFGPSVQELPVDYCRTRFTRQGRPVVEFNMKFFNDYYKDRDYRIRVLNTWPLDFKKGYSLYVEGKLPGDYSGDEAGWYLLDYNLGFKLSINGTDSPLFLSVIPYIIDLDEAQELDRKRMAQKLLKIIIQKMPVDKNGDLIFDPDEAQDLHNNVVKMLGKAIGLDVLTTYADVDVADMADKGSVTAVDELEKIERTVYNESGTAQNLFNTDGNIALEKSILDDEATLYNFILQYQDFLNQLIEPFNKSPKKYRFGIEVLPTTIYNYKELAKVYKEQVQLGYSKPLPQIALGHSQSSVLATAKFENEILKLHEVFTPPMSSNNMSADALKRKSDGDGKAGRKEKEDDKKAEKTIQNKESMS